MGRLCGVTPDTVWLRWLVGEHTGGVARSLCRDVAVMQRRNRSRTHWSPFTLCVCSPSHQTLTASAVFLTDSSFGRGLRDVFLYGIVMANCMLLMSCLAEERIPVGQWRCLLFINYMRVGTASCNDFLLPLFLPCLRMKRFSVFSVVLCLKEETYHLQCNHIKMSFSTSFPNISVYYYTNDSQCWGNISNMLF